ncbi:phosphatidylinositol N-acetylglucosaminyltransferase subunit H [Drosophila guanche]|uniref:Phosphatidylinositol N-acetylglucosaminyltransferase subunit H n=1 Tax=Drosophila guanche TaxID=7266 RepID=A0A3B0JD52_DROGU|nr:phosphatidylinositol N-acetylglucosaminyltransferase subunit H [Drosophila guanche]SPP80317.1 Hypothetical predicted protein [Drosophila guanche]
MEPELTRKRFYSLGAKYAGSTEEDLEVCIKNYGGDVVRIELVNRLHGAQCQRQLRRFLLLLSASTVYFISVWRLGDNFISIWQPRILYPIIIVATLAIVIIRTALALVKTEKLFYSWDMALQTETVRSFGRESVFCVQRGHIHDIVLNEVIENLDVKYMLILRTRGSMFKKRPIIPLFHSQSPSFECLQHIYRILHRHWLNSDKDRSEHAYNKDAPVSVASQSSSNL